MEEYVCSCWPGWTEREFRCRWTWDLAMPLRLIPENQSGRACWVFLQQNYWFIPPETVVAEKLEAAVLLGLRNSRMKDFFDLHWLSCSMEFQLATLCTAVRATFEKRGTALPEVIPVALTETFSSEPSKVTQWEAFLRKSKLPAGGLKEVAVRLQTFLTPVLFPPLNSELMVWRPGSGWKPVD